MDEFLEIHACIWVRNRKQETGNGEQGTGNDNRTSLAEVRAVL
jgi:hypothetical protein